MSNVQRPPRLPRADQVLNLARSVVGLAMTRLRKQPVIWGSPVMAMIEPTTACQLRCPHCPTGRGELSRHGGTLTFQRFREIWDGIQPAPMLLQLWNQGEPLVNQDTPDIIRYAAASGARVVMSSNVELIATVDGLADELVASGLAELILSLDGATPASHAKYRVGGDFTKVEEGVRRMVAAKKKLRVRHPQLTWQFLLFRHNLHEIPEARRLAKVWGVDRIVFKTAQLESFDRAEGETWLPEDPKLRRYTLKDEKWVLKRIERPFCQRILTSTVIQADGGVVPCCFDKDGEYVMGNVLTTPFSEIWQNERYQSFRTMIQNGNRPPMCSNCTEGFHHLYARP